MKHLINGVVLSILCLAPVEALAHKKHHHHNHFHNPIHTHCHDHPRRRIRHCHAHKRGKHHPTGVIYAPYPYWTPHPYDPPIIEFNFDL